MSHFVPRWGRAVPCWQYEGASTRPLTRSATDLPGTRISDLSTGLPADSTDRPESYLVSVPDSVYRTKA
eukprot:3057067-Rhodomonas_salina.2